LVRCQARPVRCHQRSEEGNEAKKAEQLCLHAVMPLRLLFVVLAVLFAQSALAQQFYRWEDQKGRWHYSDFPPSGVTAEKLEIGDTPQTLELQPSVSSTGEQKKAEHSSDHSTQAASDVDPLGSAPRYLLVFPPFDPGKPLSEWIPVESFDSAAECFRALQFGVSIVESTDFPRDTRASVNFGTLNSRCISLAEFKPLKEANVIVAVTILGSDPGGFSTWVLYGRVFNGGRTTARNVVVRYRAQDARGIIYANGEILPAPQDIPPLTFADYRGQIVGSAGGSDRWVETEAKWSKD
jgi:hypothetical protein